MTDKKIYITAMPFFPEEDIDSILDDIKYLLDGRGLFTKGPKVREFEKKFADYVGVDHALAVNSCTSALEIALEVIGIQQGDEVIVPTQTFFSTASAVIKNGGSPVFCEIDTNHVLDFEDLKQRVTENTKAVIIVHFLGLIHPQILEIKEFLSSKNIYLIEDAAHTPGAKIDGVHAGNIGDFGCFSFYSTKVLTTGGEGGMITVRNADHFDKCNNLRNIGVDTTADKEIFTEVGSNRRMTEMQAILGIHQLSKLDEFVAHRNNIASIYQSELAGLIEDGVIELQKYGENIPSH